MKVLFGALALAAVALCCWFLICRSHPVADARPVMPLHLSTLEDPFPDKGEEETRFFLSGLYAGYEESAYCTAWDTLIIHKDHAQANVYHVERHTSFQRNIGDNYLPVQKSVSRWIATWDSDGSALKAIDAGPDLSADTKKSTLSAGKYHFSKIE